MRKEYTQEELEELLSGAYSVESRAGHGKSGAVCRIGTVQRGNRLYDVYMDRDSECWYGVRIITKRKTMSEFESIFGRPERRAEKVDLQVNDTLLDDLQK